MAKDTRARVRVLLQEIMELGPLADDTSIEQTQTSSWTSMAHIELVLVLEEEFGITISAQDITLLTSDREIAQIIDRMTGDS